jgi:hypothetical protein
MSNDKMREEFCSWLLEEHGLESQWQPDRNCFKDFPAHLAYMAWQASREAVVIDLPSHGAPMFNSGLEQCKSAIEAAGVKVKQ